MRKLKNFKIILFFVLFPLVTFAQTIKGVVTDADGNPLSNANVIEKGTKNGTATDETGQFNLNVKTIPTTIIVKYIGHQDQIKEVKDVSEFLTFVLGSSNQIEEVILVSNRGKARTVLTSPSPIDNIYAENLKSSGQISFDKMLAYKVPSFNSTNQAISDATAHFDPADLRGLGPSRTLVLVNGKRKNQSALVYVNDTPGKGEVGTDLKSIPSSAIERIEILRDGASSQYGSDAIAGVVNIILKKQTEKTYVNLTSGITSEGDGFNFGADINTGINLKDKGFANFTLSYFNQDKTNRPGTPGEDALFGVYANDPTWGTWFKNHPDLGMNVGQPKLGIGILALNAEYKLSDKITYYLFGDVNLRKGTSYALYRTPYWITTDYGLLHESGSYEGFQPTFETDINDNLLSTGLKFDLLGFDSDASFTYGSNAVDYTIGNTINPSLGASSPTQFNAGGYTFSQMLGNIDFSRTFNKITFGLGTELRLEQFETRAGQVESYINGGAQSFPGLQPANALKKDRKNIGFYSLLDFDITDAFLLGGSIRYENYSDFGNNFSWKLNSRYKIGDKGAIRASYSTGFRAPSLHQIYLSNIQTLISGGTVSNQGTFNNVDPVIRVGLGVPQLHAEKSKNLSAGITFKAGKNFTASVDYFNIRVDDRVLFSGEVGFDGDNSTTNPVEAILDTYDVTSLKFFINAVNTITNGVDVVLNYKNIKLGTGDLAFNVAATFAKTEIDGQIATPNILKNNGYDIFSRKEQGRILFARPNTKIIVGSEYKIGKTNFILNNTYFGEVTWQHASDPLKDQTFKGKLITDLGVYYQFSEKFSASIFANNLLNVYPDVIDTKGDVVTDLGGRFKYPWEVNQFGFNGTTFLTGLNFTF